jgi:hypothetical protein
MRDGQRRFRVVVAYSISRHNKCSAIFGLVLFKMEINEQGFHVKMAHSAVFQQWTWGGTS